MRVVVVFSSFNFLSYQVPSTRYQDCLGARLKSECEPLLCTWYLVLCTFIYFLNKFTIPLRVAPVSSI
jgi:hypothetical protein